MHEMHQDNKKGVGITTVHEDTLQGLTELLEYVKGDSSKARAVTITIPDDEGQREPFDYTQWRQRLFPDTPLDVFLEVAQKYRDAMKELL